MRHTHLTAALLIASLLAVIGGASRTAAQARGQQSPPPAGVALPVQPASPKPLFADATPVRSCESLTSVTLPNTTIVSAAVDPGAAAAPPFCRVTVSVTHPPAGDKVIVWLALPVKNWNGRFQGVGGGGMSGGSENSLRGPVSAGYAAGATDTGHEGGGGSFALDSNGRANWMLIRDNAYLGIHDMTVTGKALTEAFYGKAPRYAYFNGCSTGGRQGLSEAQRYPADYDGILAGAPAINFPKLHVEQLWGQLLMLEAKNVVPMCKFNAATEAAVKACDALDGVTDGVLEDPRRCTYDPKALIGTSAGECGPFTESDAAIIRGIWSGPRRADGSFLWYGLARGGAFALSATGGSPLAGRPFGITLDWFRYFVTANPQWDWTTITHASYEQLWDQSLEQFGPVIGTDNPDLAAFRDRGGRIVLWHGWSDQLIYPEGTIDYFTRVQRQMGGAESTAKFARLFMAPGVAHCGGGTGPAPANQFDAVLAWVEQGQAPDTLTAIRRDQSGQVTRSRPLCRFPLVARYSGKGSTDDAANFSCRAGS